jgi:hypothetical protein
MSLKEILSMGFGKTSCQRFLVGGCLAGGSRLNEVNVSLGVLIVG